MNLRKSIFCLFFIILDFLFAIIAFNFFQEKIFTFLVLYTTLSMSVFFIFLFKNLSENIFLILFLFSFSIFFLINPYISIIDSEDIILNIGFSNAMGVILLAISGIKLGVFFNQMFNTTKNSSPNFYSKNLVYYRKSALVLFLLTLPFFIYNQFQVRQVMLNYGYAEIYKTGKIDVIFRISQFTISFYYLFLSCFPTKKEFINSLILFLPVVSLTLITGERSQIVLHSLVLFSYYVIRNAIKGYHLKISFRLIFTIVFIIILSSNILMLISNLRIGHTDNSNISFFQFLKQQSSTFELLADGIVKQDSLKRMSNLFSIQAVLNGVEAIRTPLKFFLPSIYNDVFSHNLGSVYTYLRDPVYFYLGGSFGTTYLLELFLDGGWLIVILVNVIIGYSLKIRNLEVFKNWIILYFTLISLRSIYFMPRESLLNFMNQFISVTNISSLFIILLIGQTLSSMKR
ncbi:O-antigen polysaccharide polymerase Wzy [Atopobacter sp. AH10]|uniref:O-antigen polysaccharide polymerase Wzy n=1 Tax=Atopobacter sp. AH10 TaxID=2315861 RepID=UPI000EF1C66B|nr:O-antigen polysaccharide polymerase Wzy [Atopobacter sp. AH10]RLK63792.1 O-antigen polysaccharide polymerase Wzy [Atopobacter sp. AH10]